jgi:hypothetical protein
MIALAVMEDFRRIELFGVDMSNDTEYKHQREGMRYWQGVCDGLGISLVIPEGSALKKGGLYGYDGDFQMIARQTLEKIKRNYTEQYDDIYARMLQSQGALKELKQQFKEAANDEEKKQLQLRGKQMMEQTMQLESDANAVKIAVNVINNLIDTVDLKVPDLTVKNNLKIRLEEVEG